MVLVLALCVCNVYAQTIKGKVVDEKIAADSLCYSFAA